MKADAFWRVIRTYPDVRRLWLGETTAAFGSYFFRIALMWYVYVRTGSGTAIGLVVVVGFLPEVVLAPWFGVVADRLNRRRMMVASNAASAMVAGLLAGAVALHVASLSVIATGMLLMGAASAFYDPARSGLFPDIVQRQDLLTAHALFHTSRQAARLVGSSLGGVIVAMAGAVSTMALDVVTFSVSALWVAHISYPRGRSPAGPGQPSPSAVASARAAWEWMRRRPVILVMSGIGMVSNIALGPSNVLPPMLIRHTFHAGSAALGVFDAAIGLGIMAGGIVIGMITINRMGLSMAAALGIETLGLLAVALSPTPLGADAGNLLLGIGLVAANAPGGAMMQTIVPSELLGRVSSFSTVLNGFAIPITYGGVGALGDAIGAQGSYGLAAGLMAACLAAALLVPGIRSFRLTEAGRDAVSESNPSAEAESL